LIQELWDALKQKETMLSETGFAKLAAHLMLLKNLCVWCLCVFLILGLPFLCLAQELELRRWSQLPTGDYMNDKTHQPRYEPIYLSVSVRGGT
jgi:hypothetical protein